MQQYPFFKDIAHVLIPPFPYHMSLLNSKKILRMHSKTKKINLTEHKTSYFGWRQMYSIFYMIKSTALGIHTLIEYADDGSLQRTINNRFGHHPHFKFRNIIYIF
jgi:hypothetical protein